MACPRSLEILQLLENKLYHDLGKIIISYLNFKPPSPEELCIDIMIHKKSENFLEIFLCYLKNHKICKDITINIKNTEVRVTWSFPDFANGMYIMDDITLNQYLKYIQTD